MLKLPTTGSRVLDGELETEYREFRRHEEGQSLTVAGVVVCVGILAFAAQDLKLVESAAIVGALLTGRLITVGLFIVAYFNSRGDKGHEVRDRWVTILAMSVVLLDFAAGLSRPEGFSGSRAFGPLIVVLLYVTIPGPQRSLAAAAILESIGSLAASIQNGADATVVFSLVGAFAIANTLGLLAMARMNHWGRDQFKAFRSLQKTNKSLREARAEVRKLREIVPICASCKSVRDDKGFWQRVEVYIGHYSGGEISHGLCPDCYAALSRQALEDTPTE